MVGWFADGCADGADMRRNSIREFCDLKMPLLMFDKDGNFVVLKLEEVSLRPRDCPYRS